MEHNEEQPLNDIARKIVAWSVTLYGAAVLLFSDSALSALLIAPLVMHLYHFYFVYEPQSLLVVAIAVDEDQATEIAEEMGADFTEVLIIRKKDS